jgi:hypothetical protein
MRKRVLVWAVVVCAVTATSASAQMVTNMAKRVGVGGSVGGIFTTGDDVNAGVAFGANVGLAPAQGFGPTLGFGWYEGDLAVPAIGGGFDFGHLRVRPLMAGVGYAWVRNRVATSVSFNAGISFNSVRVNDPYRASVGQIEVSNSFAARPQFRVEYAVARKVGVYTSVGYFLTQVDAEIGTAVGVLDEEWDASSVNVFVGVMVYPFK